MKQIARQLVRLGAVFSLLLPAVGMAALVIEAEPNDTLATAQSVDGHFSLDFSPDIGNGTFVDNTSLTIPHVTVRGSGDGTFDYYSFYFPGAGSTFGFIVLDIDYTSSSFDSRVALWSASGTLLGHNDDYDFRGGAGGSIAHYGLTMSHDSLMTTFLPGPGTYIVGVGRFGASPGVGGYTGGFVDAEPQAGDLYTLQISVENVPVVPEPSTSILFATGAIALLAHARRKHRRGTGAA